MGRLPLLVDCINLKPVKVAWFEVLDSRGTRGGCHLAGSDPLITIEIHHPKEISDDGGASIVLGRIPRQLHVLSSYLIWLEKPWFAWYVKNIDKASCFKASSLTSEPDPVQPRVGCPVRLLHCQHRVPLAVDSLLCHQLKGNPLIWLDDSALPLPGDCRRRLASKPDIIPKGVALFQLYIIHSGLVDERFHISDLGNHGVRRL